MIRFRYLVFDLLFALLFEELSQAKEKQGSDMSSLPDNPPLKELFKLLFEPLGFGGAQQGSLLRCKAIITAIFLCVNRFSIKTYSLNQTVNTLLHRHHSAIGSQNLKHNPRD